ncbi:FYN-binding protein 1-like [Polymixia lowei]
MVNSIKSITPKTPTTQKPNVVGKSGPQVQPVSQRESTDPFAPKMKTLPALFSLGNPPLKPKRPSSVDIKKFKNNGPLLNDGQGLNKMGPLSAALSTPQSNSFPAILPLCPPSNRTAAMSQPLDQEESYDDVGAMNRLPGHLAQNTEEYSEDLYEDLDERWTEQEDKSKKSQNETRGEETKHTQKEKNTEEESGDIYEDLEQPWTEQETKEINNSKEIKGQEKKTKKDEKKQLQQEKKLQKANEKREQEAKKKFKIKGPVQVIQKGNARLECKGGRTDLPLKQGEIIEIIRIVDNPEGRWLGRNSAGAYGYVKTESIDIDYDHLKQQSLSGVLTNMSGTDPEVYDDVGAQMDACGGPEGQNAGDDEIYDNLDGPDQDISFPPPPPPIIDEEDLYDDVESQGFPPPLNDLSQFTPKGKSEVMDTKKKKKFEKEEKEFRKKFKFEGEIHVLYDVTIATTLTTKKWGNKDLQLKPGEVIDVIVKPVGGKLIGRSREGQFGYVAVENIAQDMGDIYDDIGEDCIYDND